MEREFLDDAPRDQHGRRKAWRKRILLADSECDMAHLIRSDLERGGHFVDVAPSAAEAAERARCGLYDIAVLDLELDGLGYQVLRAWRDDPTVAHLGVVALSSDGGPDDIEVAYESGADVVLTLPFAFGELNLWAARL